MISPSLKTRLSAALRPLLSVYEIALRPKASVRVSTKTVWPSNVLMPCPMRVLAPSGRVTVIVLFMTSYVVCVGATASTVVWYVLAVPSCSNTGWYAAMLRPNASKTSNPKPEPVFSSILYFLSLYPCFLCQFMPHLIKPCFMTNFPILGTIFLVLRRSLHVRKN